MKRYFLHTENPNIRDIKEITEKLEKGDIVIFPTDSVYAIGCLMTNKAGVEKICRIMDKKEKQMKMSLICPNISVISQYTPQISNDVFKTMKRYLPGPFTFILKSNNFVQKFFKNNKEEIGVRIPENNILMTLLQNLEVPLISTSLNKEDAFSSHYTDADMIEEDFKNHVDILMDGGPGELFESTILDCTGTEIEVLRQGKGELE